MKRNLLLKLFLSIAVFSLTATKIFSQTGSVTGLITDQNGILWKKNYPWFKIWFIQEIILLYDIKKHTT